MCPSAGTIALIYRESNSRAVRVGVYRDSRRPQPNLGHRRASSLGIIRFGVRSRMCCIISSSSCLFSIRERERESSTCDASYRRRHRTRRRPGANARIFNLALHRVIAARSSISPSRVRIVARIGVIETLAGDISRRSLFKRIPMPSVSPERLQRAIAVIERPRGAVRTRRVGALVLVRSRFPPPCDPSFSSPLRSCACPPRKLKVDCTSGPAASHERDRLPRS